MRRLLPLLVVLFGCTASSSRAPRPSPPELDASIAIADAVAEPAPAVATKPKEDEPPPRPSYERVQNRLFAERTSPVIAECPQTLAEEARILCLFDVRYRGDTKARGHAVEMFTKWSIVAGVEPAHTMNGGYRGMIELVPAVPVGSERKHIAWITSAFHDFDQFFLELRARGGDAGRATASYRFAPIEIGFLRSPKARTPSAYASTEHGWMMGWNLAGSLHRNEDAVRETLFHEIFHLNDSERRWWSKRALAAIFDVPAKKCGTSIACLGPYTPNDTIVVGGTYYSFQPGNGVIEYAAELALRYYREQRAALRNLPLPKAFKCGPPENSKAWVLMRDEFFGGIDAVPACP